MTDERMAEIEALARQLLDDPDVERAASQPGDARGGVMRDLLDELRDRYAVRNLAAGGEHMPSCLRAGWDVMAGRFAPFRILVDRPPGQPPLYRIRWSPSLCDAPGCPQQGGICPQHSRTD